MSGEGELHSKRLCLRRWRDSNWRPSRQSMLIRGCWSSIPSRLISRRRVR
jgi:hypothetical protein